MRWPTVANHKIKKKQFFILNEKNKFNEVQRIEIDWRIEIFILGEHMSDELESFGSNVDFDTSDGGLTFLSTSSKFYIKSICNTIVNTYEFEIWNINEL